MKKLIVYTLVAAAAVIGFLAERAEAQKFTGPAFKEVASLDTSRSGNSVRDLVGAQCTCGLRIDTTCTTELCVGKADTVDCTTEHTSICSAAACPKNWFEYAGDANEIAIISSSGTQSNCVWISCAGGC